ncbi:hypothetical protein HCN44_010300 [Aphidius gifuensis]|uniref:RRM domain-containing protein n=1 Tax=Aphidius gifuensis TaxID=684658 RepID=A0A834XUJ0_APHGI|nr:hypothetical protein HCN44_010300 [Aphidius gifuensis]
MEEMELGNSEEKLRNMKMKETDDVGEAVEPFDEQKSSAMAVENENSEEDNLESNDDDNDDDDDDEDDNDDQNDADNEKEVNKLENILLENPYDYTSHLSLIKKLQSMGELDRLRRARENMSLKYPLSPELWLSWIRDEIKLVVSPNDRLAVEKLCERSVKDYLSVDVWLEYLQFSIGAMGSNDKDKDPKKAIRQLFERALTAVGLHVTKGAIIWEAYREFENILVSMVTTDAERKEGIDRIAALFRRQLACPLLDMEKTLEEYLEWRSSDGSDSSVDEKIVTANYYRASTELASRLSFEERLAASQNTDKIIDIYKEYLIYEKQHGDPGRVCVLYERILSDLSLESQFWIDYINYVDKTLKNEELLLPIYERSTRNVPWCTIIWKNWIRSLEKWNKPLLNIQNVLENSLVAGLPTADDYRNIWMTYLEYLRRRIDPSSDNEKQQIEVIRNAFNKACEHLAGLDGDLQCVVLQFWARTEAVHAADMEKARTIWSNILAQGHSAYASSWLEYITLEKCYGDTKHLRKLYQKALVAVTDWPESITNSWLEFERDEGTLEQMEICEDKIKDKLDKVAEERLKNPKQGNYYQQNVAQEQLGKKPMKRKGDDGGRSQGPANKQGKIDRSKKPKVNDSLIIEKNKKTIEDKKQKITPPPGYIPLEEKKSNKVPPPPGYVPTHEEKSIEKVPPPPGYAASQEDEKMETNQDVDDKITVFVSNLDYDATEEEIKLALAPAGKVTLFKMIKDFKGRSKGFYALKLDRVPINGRPMFVSRCDPDKTTRGCAFKYACALEKNKLFVKGLPVTTTKEDLENIFKKYGTLTDVRLVTYRNGHSKGIAYVDFVDDKSAGKAVLAVDGMSIGDKIISVAISQPPERRKTNDDTSTKSLGGTTTSRTHFGVPKTLLSMVPRNVKPQIKNDSTSSTIQTQSKPMSNHDFRTLLLSKK